MDEVWNLWETKPPPVCTMKMFLYLKEINNLNDILFNASQTLKNVGYLHKEAAILSRFLYKRRRAFRHDKGTQDLVKINQCLKRYLKLNLLETINTFKQSIPAKLHPGATHAYLPTRQMLKWVLLRLQAFSQIFKRVIELSKHTGVYTSGKLFHGWAASSSLVIFAMTARILASSKYLLAKSIEWYNSLYRCLPYLEDTVEYLPEYKFPVDLRKWLGDIDIMPPKKKSTVDDVFDVIDLVGLGEGENDENEIEILNEKLLKPLFDPKGSTADSDLEEVTVEEVFKKKGKKRRRQAFQSEDLGVPVEDDVEKIPRKKFSRKRSQEKFSRSKIFYRTFRQLYQLLASSADEAK